MGCHELIYICFYKWSLWQLYRCQMRRTVVLRAEDDSGLTWAATVIMERRSYLKQSKSPDGLCFIWFLLFSERGRKILLRSESGDDSGVLRAAVRMGS